MMVGKVSTLQDHCHSLLQNFRSFYLTRMMVQANRGHFLKFCNSFQASIKKVPEVYLFVCRKSKTFRVVIKLVARVDLHHLKMFLSGQKADAPHEALQGLDIVLRELPTTR